MKHMTTFWHSALSLSADISLALHRFATKLLGPCSEQTEKHHSVPTVMFCLLCALSVLSQIDVIAAIPFCRFIVIGFWGLAFFYGVIKTRLHLPEKTLLFCAPLLLFDLMIFLIGLIKGAPMIYLTSPIVYAANLSGFVFVTGALFGEFSGESLLKTGVKVYVLCTLVVAVYTILTTFSVQGVSSYLYVYSRKNSLAPIVLTAICCVIFLKPFQKDGVSGDSAWHVPLLMIFGTFFVLLKSRANFIGFAVVLVIWYICSVKNKDDRRKIFWNVVTIMFLILAVSTLRELVVDHILLNHRADLGVSGISSGRSDQITEVITTPAPSVSYITGNGYTYVETLPLAAILSYGIFATGILILFALTPLYSVVCAKKQSASASFVLFLFAISVAFLLNGIFEERAPFGPGVTYFILWFFSGFFTASAPKQNTETTL